MKTELTLAAFVLVAASATASAADAPELVITPRGNEILIDYVNDSKESITALMYSIDIGDAPVSSVDLSECTAGLPATHVGFCRWNPGVVKVVIYSGGNSLLTSGPIGSVSVVTAGAQARQRGHMGDERRNQLRAGGAEAGNGRRDRLRSDADPRRATFPTIQDAVFTRVDGTDVVGEVLQ